MKLSTHPMLDALCGEYLLGTLRGRARHRFEQALAQEPVVAARLAQLQGLVSARLTECEQGFASVQPAERVWMRLASELRLAEPAPKVKSARLPWWQSLAVWRGWAIAATGAAAALTLGIAIQRPSEQKPSTTIAESAPRYTTIASLVPVKVGDKAPAPDGAVSVEFAGAQGGSAVDHLRLRTRRPVEANAQQSFELWVIPAGAKPISLAIIGRLDSDVIVPRSHVAYLAGGATLAITVEPAGGSPIDGPTGPAILAGVIGLPSSGL